MKAQVIDGNKQNTIKITCAAVCLALALVLPFLTGQIKQVGNMLCPMHLPVLLCGFVCGWPWGLAIGFIAPLLRSVMFGMPVMFPSAAAMSVELAVYGFLAGYLYKVLPKKIPFTYLALLLSMFGGRIVWCAAQYAFARIQNGAFVVSAMVAGAFTNALPGMLLQLVLIPAIIFALKKAKLIS